MQGFMRLSPGEYFTDPLKNKSAVIADLFGSSFVGLKLDAPPLVELDARTGLPLLAMHVWPNQVLPQPDFKRTALLTAVDLRTGFVHAAPAFDLGARGRPSPPARPDPDQGPLPEGMNARTYEIDARGRLDLPWEPAELLLTIVTLDQLSNRVRVKLEVSAATYRDPEVARFVEEQRARAPFPAVHPSADDVLPSYRKRPSSPAIPEASGIALSVERIHVTRPDAPALVHGSFRVPVGPARLVDRDAWLAQMLATSPQAVAPSALVPITLLLTGSEVATPFVWHLWVPSFDPPEEIASRKMATGYFAFDMLMLGDVAAVAQTTFIYAFSGELLTGPIPAAYVAESSLPR
jgi:hypothetical protein